MMKTCRPSWLLLVPIMALGAPGSAVADEPGYHRGATDRSWTRAYRPRKAVVMSRQMYSRHMYAPFGYFGRGWGETMHVAYGNGGAVYGTYVPYVGRNYALAVGRRHRSVYMVEPPASGLTAASLVTGANDAYKMNRCYPPLSMRTIFDDGSAIDRQQFHCRD